MFKRIKAFFDERIKRAVRRELTNIFREYGEWLDLHIATNWQRKQFSDFEYIKIGLTETQGIWLFILSIIFSVGISMICYYKS